MTSQSRRLVWLWAALYVSDVFSFRILPQQRLRRSWKTARQEEASDDVLPEGDGPSFVLPIFPLRKSVRLPGEPLTLNLYEKRYLAMAEWIRTQQQQPLCFGALYASDKPQIVSQRGRGPITPLLGTGDVGVICVVENYEEGMVDTVGGVERRRRIRIEGTAVARFVIEKILHNGYSTSAASEETTKVLPFILAQVSVYKDQPVTIINTRTASPVPPDGLSMEHWQSLRDKAQQLGISDDVMNHEITSFVSFSEILRKEAGEERKRALMLQSAEERALLKAQFR